VSSVVVEHLVLEDDLTLGARMSIWRFPVTVTAPFAGKCNNTFHIRTGHLITTEAVALQAAADALRTWYTAVLSCFEPGTTIAADGGVNVEDQSDQSVTWATITNGGGTVSTAPVLAICTSWKTASRSRRGRGRTFLGPLDAGCVQNDGTIDPAKLTLVKAANTVLVNASLVDNDWAIGVYGLENPAPKPPPGQPPVDPSTLPHVLRDFTGHAVQDKFAVMRSRRP
jgi:hypothetical protein